jgi:hypothetical protein
MPYVNYDEKGNITALFANQQCEDQAFLDENSDEIQKYTQNSTQKISLQSQIDVLDKKRIRALAEGGNYSDTQTYLEYYTEQIKELRAQL